MDYSSFDLGFTPSLYQEEIFNYILHGNGNTVISARAGSAKTSTCVSVIKMLDKKRKIIFLAFNKAIAEELSEKLKNYPNVEVKTSHSLGYSIIRSSFEFDVNVDEFKYKKYIYSNIDKLTDLDSIDGPKEEYIRNIEKLVDFSRVNLCQNKNEITKIANKYTIPILNDECEVVLKVMNWGKDNIFTVDYTDMIWLPNELSLNAKKFQKDFIFIDECQDQSIASINLFIKLFKRASRFVAVGDEKQTINTFNGSSEESFDYMRKMRNTKEFNLPICYRCPISVLDKVKRYAPDIKAKDNAIEGTILNDCSLYNLSSGDMVLGRTKSSLINAYSILLRSGMQCYIKGNEFGLNLLKMLEPIQQDEINLNLRSDGVFIRLYENLFLLRDKLAINQGLSKEDATITPFIMDRYDMIKSLEILAETCLNKGELTERVKNIFNDGVGGIILSTIHKAKGLEADNVYILCNSSLPLKSAKAQWEKDTEDNLVYVAYTRAKKTLGFISEKEVKLGGISLGTNEVLKELNTLETIVKEILGKDISENLNSLDVAKYKLSNGFNEIKIEPVKENHKVVSSRISSTNDDLLSELEDMFD